MTLIEASLSRKLTDVLGDVKVFPDEIPLKYTQDGEAKPNCTLPAATMPTHAHASSASAVSPLTPTAPTISPAASSSIATPRRQTSCSQNSRP